MNLHKTSHLGPTGSIVADLRFHNYSHLLLPVSGPASMCSLMTRSYLTTWCWHPVLFILPLSLYNRDPLPPHFFSWYFFLPSSAFILCHSRYLCTPPPQYQSCSFIPFFYFFFIQGFGSYCQRSAESQNIIFGHIERYKEE